MVSCAKEETEIMLEMPPLLQKVKCRLRGVTYCSLWYLSILLGFYFCFAPLLPLLFIHRKWYRKCTDLLFSAWEAFNVSLLEIIFGMKTFISGDAIQSDESSLIVVNHRTRVDWNFVWAAMLHASTPPAHHSKFVLKHQVKSIPGVGWTMQMCRFLYIDRCWKTDESRMDRMLQLYQAIQNDNKAEERPHKCQVILFPEGTNLTEDTKKKSSQFANKMNVKPLDNVLLPRTTGFSYLANQMRLYGTLDAVYDITIAYPDIIPEKEEDLFYGAIPNEIHFYIKRHGLSTIPSTLIGLEKWLHEMWRDKNQLLENVYKEGLRFPAQSARQLQPQAILPLQYVALFAWFAFLTCCLSCLLSISWLALYMWIWIAVVSLIMVTVSKYTGGLQELEVYLHRNEFFAHMCQFLQAKFSKEPPPSSCHSKAE